MEVISLKIKKYLRKLGEPTIIRSLKEMKSVLYDQKWYKKAKNFPVYYVWRGVKWEGDLRYDITIIPPKMLGQEFPKTKGHHHLNHFQELYQVLEGETFYFIQKGKGKNVKDCYVIKAKKGDFIIIPFNAGHLKIGRAHV